MRARTTAAHVAGLAARAEATAARLADDRRAELERLTARLDVGRLLAERRRRRRYKQREPPRPSGRATLGALAEASARFSRGESRKPGHWRVTFAAKIDNAELASLTTMIAQREMAVKTIAADEALWAVRRDLRRTPAEAVARLEAVDVEGLPSSLAAQVFGEWARAASRLCPRERGIEDPLRYAPDRVVAPSSPVMPGRGEYVVVTALGMGPAWKVGTVVGERQVRRTPAPLIRLTRTVVAGGNRLRAGAPGPQALHGPGGHTHGPSEALRSCDRRSVATQPHQLMSEAAGTA